MMLVLGCRTESPFVRLARARELSSNIAVQFLTAADASNKALMAESDQAVADFVRASETAKESVKTDVESLQPVLRELRFAAESDLLGVFASGFEEYRKLDAQILALVGENTNRRAQRLSFGPAQTEADAFRSAAEALVARGAGDEWRVRALAATAVAAVREIQALEAPHIAETTDAAMTAMEGRMATAETAARDALKAVAPLVSAASRPQLEAANSALNEFMSVHTQILELSRRNTNVRSLALTLTEKGRIAGACEDSLRALRDALAKRELGGTR
jgi:hypothetical protein